MANTTTISGRFITVVPDGSTDWNIVTDLTAIAGCKQTGIYVRSIDFHPSATNDRLVVHERSNTGATIYDFVARGADDSDIKSFSSAKGNGEWMFPYIKASDCTFGTAANCKITFELG
jgi:hypothetical protein